MNTLTFSMPVVSTDTMKQSEEKYLETVSRGDLLDRVGERLREAYPFHGPVAIVCGAGFNGADGICLAKALAQKKIPCHLFLLAYSHHGDWKNKMVQTMPYRIPADYITAFDEIRGYPEIVDCLMGTGCHGNARYLTKTLIEKINEARERDHATVISVDIPSGLDSDTGLGTPAVRADVTLALQAVKPGLLFGNGPDVCGEIRVVDIGIPLEGDIFSRLTDASVAPFFRKRPTVCHKGSFGTVSLLGGCRSYGGAVKLANLAQSALRSGCGIARLCVPDLLADAVSPYLLESTLKTVPSDGDYMKYDPVWVDELLASSSALAVGMGWGQGPDNEKILSRLLTQSRCPLLVDADGLNTLARMGTEILSRASCPVILTPHPKEFERLSGRPLADIVKDPIHEARAFAEANHCIVLLKGTTTVVTNGTEVLLSDTGCAGMATAGSGDVLSGILLGLLGYAPAEPFTVAVGAYLAGRAGEKAQAELGDIGMLAGDTVRSIAHAIHQLQEKT